MIGLIILGGDGSKYESPCDTMDAPKKWYYLLTVYVNPFNHLSAGSNSFLMKVVLSKLEQ